MKGRTFAERKATLEGGDVMIAQADSGTNGHRSGSTGPRTEGREGSRYNAMKHGLTARIVLPWEDEEQYDARLARYKTGLPIRSELEEELAERGASFVADGPRLARGPRTGDPASRERP